jgi:RimJ/RimL family protein N-acetyltransferase
MVAEHRRVEPGVALRPWAPTDRDLLVGLMVDPEGRRYLGGPVDRDVAEQRVSARTGSASYGSFVVELDGTPVGTVTFDRKRGPWEVSFQLAAVGRGRGAMSCALRQAVRWFRAAEPEEPLIAVTQESNWPARRTIERVGGRATAVLEQYGQRQVEYLL